MADSKARRLRDSKSIMGRTYMKWTGGVLEELSNAVLSSLAQISEILFAPTRRPLSWCIRIFYIASSLSCGFVSLEAANIICGRRWSAEKNGKEDAREGARGKPRSPTEKKRIAAFLCFFIHSSSQRRNIFCQKMLQKQ